MTEDILDIDDEMSLNHSISTDVTLNTSMSINKSDFDFVLPSDSFPNKISGTDDVMKYSFPVKTEQENFIVSADHCYARPWNWRPETSFLQPTKSLFVNKLSPGLKKSSNPLVSIQEINEVIDVESEPTYPSTIHDFSKAKILMDECQNYVFNARSDNGEEDWKEKISKVNWTSTQNRIFTHMMNILNSFKLSKITYMSVENEPLMRSMFIRKAVQRVRRLMATIAWDQKLTQWLHQFLLDNLDPHYLTCYLEILQTLKSKLPAFVEKMIHTPNSTTRSGLLSIANISQLLDKSWDQFLPSALVSDKPKKLPGNPILILVPTAPLMPKIINKWIKLLSTLATVVAVPTNFGSTGHRMTLSNCVDHLFSLTRGKIQEVRTEYPSRNIVLVGFNAGATLALQVAQVETVLCVVSFGFSLLTTEGRRGEPEDNLLELQCPVLFVIGQRSNTSFQEDMEDLRERMRVETGLIVVGSADDYLRVSKKKRRLEGITQAAVDKCIIDEVGDFISGLILSPYPPQIRQSSCSATGESALKKTKSERTRYNSNASSVDSEPPSPTPRITRPVGRPPGSKTKSRLEAKWAQQIAQGNPNDPSFPPKSTSPSLISNTSAPDTVPIQSLQKSEMTVKKLKTLKPVVSPIKQASSMVKTLPQQARIQAYGLNRSITPGGNLSTLLQGGIKTIPPSQPKPPFSGIKVLENVALNNSTTAKLLQNKTVDLSKVTLINPLKSCNNTTVGNVYLLPDGKLKTKQSTSVIGTGSTPIILPLATQKNQIKPISRNKYITTKRQLLGLKPPRPAKVPPYNTTSMQTSLLPPTNLTTQDIMDLPIIFADDNKILEANLSPQSANNVAQITTIATTNSIPNAPATLATSKILQTITPGKFMLVNKQTANPSNLIITSTNFKKQNSTTLQKSQPKFTKIILSSKKHNLGELQTAAKLQTISSEVTLKKVIPKHIIQDQVEKETLVELIDLENEIKATAVPKPNINIDKHMLVHTKVSDTETLSIKPDTSLIMKRPSSVLETVDDGDPDYVPPKNLRLQ